MDSFTGTTSNREFLRNVPHALQELRIVVVGLDPDQDEFAQSVHEEVPGYVLNDASALPDKLIFQPHLKSEMPVKQDRRFAESLKQ